MRSSIACARCRRSKVKCINNGVNTRCKACETSGRECTYPPPATSIPGGSSARKDGNATAPTLIDPTVAIDTPRKPSRPKKVAQVAASAILSTKDSPKALVDALDPAILTPAVWNKLFEIFQLHFSTDLPFLHPPTFVKPLRQTVPFSPNTDVPERGPPAVMPPGSPLFLLAFLALTSRFHPQLISVHSPSSSTRPQNPLAAAEYYATAAKARLNGIFGDEGGKPSLDYTQALLMLGLHEWSMCRGAKAWLLVGVAVRSAQVLGLQFEQDLDDQPLARSFSLDVEAQHLGISKGHADQGKAQVSKNDTFIQQEIRRRTFWSCFIMDRYLSSGKFRPQMLDVKEIRVQLPCSERAFLFGNSVKTSLLCEGTAEGATREIVQNNRQAYFQLATRDGHDSEARRTDHDRDRLEIGSEEGVLSRFIKTLDVYGRIVKWSCAGGRRQEQFPPWDSRCTFFELRKRLAALRDGLPYNLSLSASNIDAHITDRTSTPFTLMHTLHALCSIMLHREYVPFLPLRCSKPQGPLDPPLFPPEEYQVPAGFWEDSARELFSSAREFIDLLRACQNWEVLMETPIIGFTTYTAAFTGVYAINFPWMDPEGNLCSRYARASNGNSTSENDGGERSRKALELVGQMRKTSRMADGWFKTIKKCHQYYMRIKKDYSKNSRALEAGSTESAESIRQLSLREGGIGGGLEEYKLIERALKDFGTLEDEDIDMLDAETDSGRAAFDEASEAGSAMKSEIEASEATPDAYRGLERWNAINNSSSTPASTSHPSPYPADPNNYKPGPGGVSLLSPTQPQAQYGSNPSYERSPYNGAQAVGSEQPSNRPQYGTFTPNAGNYIAPEAREAWLNNLDTRFGGDDVAAFVAGNTWEEFPGLGGWLGNVWNGASPATAGSS